MHGHELLQQQALVAVNGLAARLGVEHEGLEVLSARGNLIARLSGTDVVARAATLTARTRQRPAEWFAREVKVATAIAAVSGPVVPPSRLVPPGPYVKDGLAITLWTYTEADSVAPSPEDAGVALSAFHGSARHFMDALDLPVLTPVYVQIPDAIAALRTLGEIDGDTLLRLERKYDRVLDMLDGAGSQHIVLHGDAHPGNLMHSAGRWLWFDLEETCVGPPEWDLAVLSQTGMLDGRAAVDAYARDRGIDSPGDGELQPFVRARQHEAAVWALVLTRYYPERYQDLADSLLEVVLAPH